MSYNNSYNTRSSGRYNTPGRFVSGGELAPGGPVGSGPHQSRNYNGNNYHPRPYQQYNRQNQQQQQQQSPQQPPPQQPQQQLAQQQTPPQRPPALSVPIAPSAMLQPTEQQNLLLQNWDVEMGGENPDSKESEVKPHWMKSRLSGVKKITNKERRRRQNENLRRLLAPKNALMVLNEMMPSERDAAQFKVEPSASPFVSDANSHIFCAELTIDGTNYKGYGDNKIAARNDAAEQAIRDLIIKRMAKANSMEVAQGNDEKTGEEDEDAPLPMIQLASFALHKLFAEWECDGHKVPQLKPNFSVAANDASSEASGPTSGGGGAAGGGAARAKPPRALPAGAGAMHPCMLLTYMRPHLEYRELAVEGDRPQNMLFTMGIEVDGVKYVGKATNKREARKKAARAACEALFGVAFSDCSAPLAPTAPAAPSAAAAPAASAADVKPEMDT
ncbi:uncharacterized protein [Epargyreus clarus]|uniref:uncharacterized protein isoform X2 n=1 Tax=Epargyreus clarus TaxID=520877 RepID=UPI003C309192